MTMGQGNDTIVWYITKIQPENKELWPKHK